MSGCDCAIAGRASLTSSAGHAVERHDIKRAMRRHREIRFRGVAAIEQIAAPMVMCGAHSKKPQSVVYCSVLKASGDCSTQSAR